MLIGGLRRALANLKRAGRLTARINGSLVTQKPRPADYGGRRGAASVGKGPAAPALCDTSGSRRPQRLMHRDEALSPEARRRPRPLGARLLSVCQARQRKRDRNDGQGWFR